MPFDAQSPASAADRSRPIAVWLLIVAAMVWIMVALGGATRLTGSGLSIMEWAPLSGALPPVSEAEWNRLYALYRTIPQYALLNHGFGLEGFQRIFWLEWVHRFWGRLIGLAYALPLAVFWLRGRILAGSSRAWSCCCARRHAGRSRLVHGRLGVRGRPHRGLPLPAGDAPGLALGLYAALLWTGLSVLRGPATKPQPRTVRRQAMAAAWLVVAAMLAGGFVAGNRAGLDYNSFPLMDGQWVPDGYWRLVPGWTNLTANIATVQFNHRLLATLAVLASLGAAVAGGRKLPAGFARRACLGLGAAACLQYALGVATLLLHVPAWLGTLHQACAVLILTAALVALHALREPGRAA